MTDEWMYTDGEYEILDAMQGLEAVHAEPGDEPLQDEWMCLAARMYALMTDGEVVSERQRELLVGCLQRYAEEAAAMDTVYKEHVEQLRAWITAYKEEWYG
jgi:hypothetical protein